MINTAVDFLGGFWTWQTPVSFLAGIGTASVIRRFVPRIEIEQDD